MNIIEKLDDIEKRFETNVKPIYKASAEVLNADRPSEQKNIIRITHTSLRVGDLVFIRSPGVIWKVSKKMKQSLYQMELQPEIEDNAVVIIIYKENGFEKVYFKRAGYWISTGSNYIPFFNQNVTCMCSTLKELFTWLREELVYVPGHSGYTTAMVASHASSLALSNYVHDVTPSVDVHLNDQQSLPLDVPSPPPKRRRRSE